MKTLNETAQPTNRAGRYGNDFGGQYIPDSKKSPRLSTL